MDLYLLSQKFGSDIKYKAIFRNLYNSGIYNGAVRI